MQKGINIKKHLVLGFVREFRGCSQKTDILNLVLMIISVFNFKTVKKELFKGLFIKDGLRIETV